MIPGGFGAAKNFFQPSATFAALGARSQLRPEIAALIRGFYDLRKPIVAICIAPAVVGMALPPLDPPLRLTLGPSAASGNGAAQQMEALGHQTVDCRASSHVADAAHRVATTPAYMWDDAPLAAIYDGIQSAIDTAVRWSSSPETR